METYDPIEKLSLLAPHAVDWRHIPSDYSRMTQSDIAARLAKIHRGAALLGRVKVAQQTELLNDLIHWLKVELMGTVIKSSTDMHDRMIRLAIQEVIEPRVCRNCHGNSQVPEVMENKPTGKMLVCEDCSGGKYAWTERARASACGVHHEVWRRHHARLYIEILTIPWTWEAEVREVLSH